MSIWLIVNLILLAVLLIALIFRARLDRHFQMVSMAACGLIVASCTIESLTEGARLWTIGLGAFAVILFAVEFVRQTRRSLPTGIGPR